MGSPTKKRNKLSKTTRARIRRLWKNQDPRVLYPIAEAAVAGYHEINPSGSYREAWLVGIHAGRVLEQHRNRDAKSFIDAFEDYVMNYNGSNCLP